MTLPGSRWTWPSAAHLCGLMKRHQALHPLSREHHPALVKAKRLIGLDADTAPDQLRVAAEELLVFWRDDLASHFRKEEDFLLPVLARYAGEDHPDILETLFQHVRIRAAVDGVRAACASGEIVDAAALRRIGELLRAHVKYEEQQLFGLVEDYVPEEELARVQRVTKAR